MLTRFLLLLVLGLSAGCASPDARIERLCDEARIAILRGAFNDALRLIDEAEGLSRERASPLGWTIHLLRAEALIVRRDVREGLAVLSALPPLQAPRPDLEARRTYLQALGQVFQNAIQNASTTIETARQQAAGAAAEDVLLDIDTLNGQLLLRRERWAEAATLLNDVVTRASARRDGYRTAAARHNLAFGHLLRGKYDEALQLFDSVLNAKELEEYTVYGSALTNAGVCQARIGHFDKAIELLGQAIRSHERRGAPVFLSQALGELGTTYLLRNEPRAAMQHLSRAFEVATGANAPDAAVWAGNLAKVAIDLREFDDAERFNREAVRLKTAAKRSTLYNTYYAALIAQGRGHFQDAQKLYEDVLKAPGVGPGLQWESHDGLASLALISRNPALASKHFDAALRIIQETRSDLLRTEYRVTFLGRVTQFYRNYVNALIASGDSARALEVTDSSRGVVLAERMGGNAGHLKATTTKNLIAASKRSGSVWLWYWLAPERSYVWVVSGDGIRNVTLAGSQQIEKLVEEYRSVIERSSSDPLATPNSPGDALYAAVIAPIAGFIPAGSSVRIVPDGALHNVNFETLPVAGPRRHYWIDDVSVAIAPSLGLLAANVDRKAGNDGRSLLLVGDPTPRLKEFPRLGYASLEMSSVSKHFEGVQVVRQDGDRATPSQFFAAQPERFSVIHFTAHAAANRTSPLESAVILAGPAGADKLYARDVAERSLRAELVTISACKSAGERAYTGEGLIGFAWAFLRAGSRQVVAGLWDVDDQSTAALMDALYGGIARGERPVEALRAAKLALIKRGGNVARPYYWGPFELFTVAP